MKTFDTPGQLVRTYRKYAKKQFGQHFLVDPDILGRIADAADVSDGDDILEVGPGCGTLTLTLLERGAEVVAVEIDRDLAEFLERQLTAGRPLEILQADVLELDLDAVVAEERSPWKAVSNLPYNIATEVFFALTAVIERFDVLALMFQKEVAERFVAGPGDDDYSLLSLTSRVWGDAEIVMTLPGGAFVPPPQVTSALIRFTPVDGSRIPDPQDRDVFHQVVRSAFQRRRKTLPNALAGTGLPKDDLREIIDAVGLDQRIRPEKVGFDDFVEIARHVRTVGD